MALLQPTRRHETRVNPYVAGNPVGGSVAFVGRNAILREVTRVAASPNENALVLYGQRRIGKTSLLHELATRLPKEGPYQAVEYDLQDKSTLPLDRVLEDLAARLTKAIGLPPPTDWGDTTRTFREQFIPSILATLPSAASLVLLVDEFDTLDSPSGAHAGTSLFPYLRELLALSPDRLKFVFVIGRRPEDLSSLTLSVFKGIKALHVSLLEPAETEELVRLSERSNSLRWSDEAVADVLALTGGHPFLTQQLCQLVWERASESPVPAAATLHDVEAAAPIALRSATNALEWLWDGLGPAERLVAAALAGAGPVQMSQDELEKRLLDGGVRILIGELRDAPKVLQDWDLIEVSAAGYRFRVELLRRWIADRKPLTRVQEEMDRIRPVAENLFQAAYGLYQGGQFESAKPLLHQAVALNPNHLRGNLLLVEILLANGEVVQARLLLESLYQYQPAAARPRLVQTLLMQAQAETNEDGQLGLYEEVLALDSQQPEAHTARQRILRTRAEAARAAGRFEEAVRAFELAGMLTEAAEVEAILRERRLRDGLQELASYEKGGNYEAAFNLGRQLYHDYPEAAASAQLPSLEVLERRTQIEGCYRQALGALQVNDQGTARKLLSEVVGLDAGYKEATRYLHLAVTGVDIAELEPRGHDQPGFFKRNPDIIFCISMILSACWLISLIIIEVASGRPFPGGRWLSLRGDNLSVSLWTETTTLALSALLWLGFTLAALALRFKWRKI